MVEIVSFRVGFDSQDRVHGRVHRARAIQWPPDKFDLEPFAGLVHLRYTWGYERRTDRPR